MWRVAVVSGLVHLVLAACLLAAAVSVAVRSNGGRCDDTPSCLEVTLVVFAAAAAGYLVVLALWASALRLLLRKVAPRSGRWSSAVVAQLVGGGPVLALGMLASGWWPEICIVFVAAVAPAALSGWASLDVEGTYAPVWRRRGW